MSVRDNATRGLLHCHPEYQENMPLDLMVVHPKHVLEVGHAIDLLRQLLAEGECYCSDGVAARGPCQWCRAKAQLKLLDALASPPEKPAEKPAEPEKGAKPC